MADNKLRMWIYTDMNDSEKREYIDNPVHIPRVGEFVDMNSFGGYVDHVQWNYYGTGSNKDFATVYVTLKETE